MSLRNTLLGAAAAVGLVLSAGAANASIIATLTGISANTAGGFNFAYNATLAADQQISSGAFFTLYDWGPATYSPTNATGMFASNFTFSQALVGPTPAQIAPVDSASVLNATFTYTGSTVNGYAMGNGAAGNLGTFTLVSPLGGANANGQQASSASKFVPPNGGGTTGSYAGFISASTVPASTVPEPASLAILGGALALAGVVRRRRNA